MMAELPPVLPLAATACPRLWQVHCLMAAEYQRRIDLIDAATSGLPVHVPRAALGLDSVEPAPNGRAMRAVAGELTG